MFFWYPKIEAEPRNSKTNKMLGFEIWKFEINKKNEIWTLVILKFENLKIWNLKIWKFDNLEFEIF